MIAPRTDLARESRGIHTRVLTISGPDPQTRYTVYLNSEGSVPVIFIRELKHVGRQHDDDGQNKFLQINDSKENLSYIIIRMNLTQYKKLKTLALCLGRVSLLTDF